MAVEPIPQDYQRVTPYLVVQRADAVIEFMKQVLDAEERLRMPNRDGTVGHAEMVVGNSVVMMGEPQDPSDLMPAMLHVYVEDVDATYERALRAGGTSLHEPKNEFYGDRTASVQDAAGNKWYFATHVEDVPLEEVQRRASEAAASAG